MNTNRAYPDDLGVFALMANALALNPLGHDSFERGAATPDAAPIDGKPARRGLFERIDNWFRLRNQRSLEAYLGKASDVYDLEARIRDIERGVVHPYY
jgi:hypothetical protein